MQYKVKALNAQQQLVSLLLEAPDEAAVRRQLQQQGLTAIGIGEQQSRLARASTAFPLLLFSQELHALLTAGLSVVEALDVLIDKERATATKAVLSRLSASLCEGLRLSAALARQPDVFPPLFVGIMQAAEGTSDLPLALSRYIDYETRLASVKQKVVSAAIYPAILIGVGGGVAGFLLGYVVPRFASVYRSSGRPLPWASQLLLDWGAFATEHALPLSLLVAAVVGWLGWRARGHLKAGTWWRMLAFIPGARPRLEVLEVSRFYLTLGMLLQGGLPITPALRLASAVLPADRHAAVAEAVRRIAEGASLTDAFTHAGLMAPVAARLLKVGERSGQLGSMLLRTAEFYEGETTRWIERFTKAFEPALMATIGLIIGAIVILLYMPIFDLAGSLQ